MYTYKELHVLAQPNKVADKAIARYLLPANLKHVLYVYSSKCKNIRDGFIDAEMARFIVEHLNASIV